MVYARVIQTLILGSDVVNYFILLSQVPLWIIRSRLLLAKVQLRRDGSHGEGDGEDHGDAHERGEPDGGVRLPRHGPRPPAPGRRRSQVPGARVAIFMLLMDR